MKFTIVESRMQTKEYEIEAETAEEAIAAWELDRYSKTANQYEWNTEEYDLVGLIDKSGNEYDVFTGDKLGEL